MYPTTMPKAFASITRTGIANNPARIRGSSRWVTGERPRLSSASICSVTRILPSSAAYRAPIRPARMGPVLTGLILAGRIGARYAAELGSMRVTEQIDALESLGRSPVTHLLLPRILAGLFAIPVLVMLANAFGIVVGYITARSSLGLTYADFEFGSRYFFRPLDLYYSAIKSGAFAGAVTIIPCYIGFNTQQGAEGVGRSTTQAVVAASVTVLMLDTILTKLILGTAK